MNRWIVGVALSFLLGNTVWCTFVWQQTEDEPREAAIGISDTPSKSDSLPFSLRLLMARECPLRPNLTLDECLNVMTSQDASTWRFFRKDSNSNLTELWRGSRVNAMMVPVHYNDTKITKKRILGVMQLRFVDDRLCEAVFFEGIEMLLSPGLVLVPNAFGNQMPGKTE